MNNILSMLGQKNRFNYRKLFPHDLNSIQFGGIFCQMTIVEIATFESKVKDAVL